MAALSAPAAPRFDVEIVRRLAGARSFARGEAYCRDGQVVIFDIDAERVLAQVSGSEVVSLIRARPPRKSSEVGYVRTTA